MAKKWGILIKKESESLIFTGLKIPRDYEREKEVENIMLAMYDEKEILREYIESERYEAEKKADKRNAIQMIKAGRLSIDEVMQFFPSLTSDDVKELQEELLQNV